MMDSRVSVGEIWIVSWKSDAIQGATEESEGIFVSFSDSGSKPGYFAVIDSRAKAFVRGCGRHTGSGGRDMS